MLPEDVTVVAAQCAFVYVRQSEVKCELSFGERFLDSSMEDSLALPVFTPMNFWRCAYKNEALAQCSQNFSCYRQFVALLDRVRGFGDQSICIATSCDTCWR